MSAVESSREENAYLAKLAEQTERYEEMVEFMEKVMKTLNGEELTVEERNLLSVAYKKVIEARRDSWRIISSIEQKEETRGNEDHVSLIKEYRGKVEAELSKICDGILKLLNSHLVPSASSAESTVFYLKMKGDYHRCLAEFKTGAERKEAAENTLLAYKSAQDIALADLASTHPITFGLALNISDFYDEILNSPDRACSLAKQKGTSSRSSKMSAVESSREENAYLAKLAEQTERYEEMVEFMEKVMKTLNGEELTVEERNLLSVAYKKVIGARRDSWRIISSIEQKEETRGNEDHVFLIKEYRGKVEAGLSKICDGILKLLDSHLVPSASSAESKVFYLTMKGDYHRYLAEFKTGAERKEAAKNTLLAYKSAQDIALADLASTHPIRLGLALNFSDFYYEILNSPDRACSLAKQAFDEAISELDTLGEESYKDSTLIMKRLRDNLTLWISDITEDGADEIKEATKKESGEDQRLND